METSIDCITVIKIKGEKIFFQNKVVLF